MSIISESSAFMIEVVNRADEEEKNAASKALPSSNDPVVSFHFDKIWGNSKTVSYPSFRIRTEFKMKYNRWYFKSELVPCGHTLLFMSKYVLRHGSD